MRPRFLMPLVLVLKHTNLTKVNVFQYNLILMIGFEILCLLIAGESMEVDSEGAAKAAFPPVKREKLSDGTEVRKVPVPSNRYTPLKVRFALLHWMNQVHRLLNFHG